MVAPAFRSAILSVSKRRRLREFDPTPRLHEGLPIFEKTMQISPLLFGLPLLLFSSQIAAAEETTPSPQRGLQLLLEKAYLPPAFDQETFDVVWQTWEEPLRSRAAGATKAERRRLAYHRYGLIERPGDPRHRPMQYVVDLQGNWTMNCLACHQGAVAGRLVPGTPNAQFALETLTHEIRATKVRLRKPFTDLDLGSLVMPLGTTVGTTNAIMFGVGLMHYRDDDLNIIPRLALPQLTHHDHDAPPWWNVSRKTRLYADNFAPRGHRALMQFLASKKNGPEKFREWEDDFRHVEAYIDSLASPQYGFEINTALAKQGRAVFELSCAECHGTYGTKSEYPERIIPWDEVRTDPVRMRSISKEHRMSYQRNWINEYGSAGDVIAEPGGYLAPPLNGIWATSPYFHNGSVPTLWHVLRPKQRPTVWRRCDANGFDSERVGLAVEELKTVPRDVLHAAQRRHYLDTQGVGKSSSGHTFPEVLTETERHAVLEYLKTL